MTPTFLPGHWYIVGTCSNCKATSPIFKDLSEGEGSLQGVYVMTCPACRLPSELKPDHYYHPIQEPEFSTA